VRREPHPNQRELASLPRELRRTVVPAAVRAWVERETGTAVTKVRRLTGASSTAVHVLTLGDGSRVALRRYVWPGFLESEPEAPGREVDALRFASHAGLRVPDVLAADVTGEDIGDGVPALLMSMVPGRAVGLPDLHALAEVAAEIHAVDATAFGHDYFPWYADTTVTPPAAARRPALWERAIVVWQQEMPAFGSGLLHRDFHPGNVLWSRRRMSGVVDWANACRGPWSCDVAHCRWNLIGLGGDAAADEFLAAYESITGATYHPYWEIASTLEHGPSHWTAATVPASEDRLARALSALRAG
jgi:aminoglycoside phosphotransferase (APT) family kinase protein